ncbi:MAG: NAD(P)H-hydrate dehydratase [Lachnospiraceae bacterium]|nr:NAD(P)H-hydrate dehydratase [Lachnospiraceae bacterium]
MQMLLNGAQMKAVDRYNIEEIGIPSVVLMERAALAVAKEAERICSPGDFVLLVCGRGNNGADGMAVARMLTLHGRKVEVLLFGRKERATEENRLQEKILQKLEVPVNTVDIFSEYPIRGGYRLVVDALFGIGLSRPLTGEAKEAARWINQVKDTGVPVLSVDIPSGISADTGQVLGASVRADVTVTFGYEKLGTILYPGTLYAGRRVRADIGFVEPSSMEGVARSFFPGEKGCLPGRLADGNKGTFGRVFLAAGSDGMSGAAFLSAKAAAKSGAGLVQIYTVKENVPVLQTLLPEAIVTAFSPGEEEMREESGQEEIHREPVRTTLDRASVLVAGPGLSVKPYARRLLKRLLEERKARQIPCVLDADALNLMAKDRALLHTLDEKVLVTPHMGEMARLTGKSIGELKEDPIRAAGEFYKRYGAVCILKDARTTVVSGKGTYVNLSGNDGMATGGSGDVLSGILGGLLAGGMKPADAAETGVYLHGLAGERAAKRLGRRAMLAGDLLEAVGEVLLDWE